LGDVVSCQYRGTFIDGKEFDNSYNRKVPPSIPVNAVMKGWAEALQLMRAGSKWQLFVPSDLAYGERGAGGHGGKRAGGPQPQTVGPNATVVFELELLSVESPGTQRPVVNAKAVKEKGTLAPEVLEQLKKVIQGGPKSANNQ
jgi:FKBP-type peptidyl-prolyl cis-trans isomerase FklB